MKEDKNQVINLAFKIQIYPDTYVKELIIKNCHYARYLWNNALAWKKKLDEEALQNVGKYAPLQSYDFIYFNQSKERKWEEFENDPMLSGMVRRTVGSFLYQSYQKFFDHPDLFNPPDFKRKRDKKMSYTLLNQHLDNKTGGDIRIWKKQLIFPGIRRRDKSCKIDPNLPLDCCYLAELPPKKFQNGKIISATFSIQNSKFFVSLTFELTQDKVTNSNKTNSIGIDLGVKNFMTAIDSNGEIFIENHSKKIKPLLKKIELIQSRKDRVTKNSKNHLKLVQRFRDLWERIRNLRLDFIHKLSKKLVDNYNIICFENLSQQSMLRANRSKQTNKLISEACWYSFRVFCQYKSKLYGSTVQLVDRFFPSTQICSLCGHKLSGTEKLTLKESLSLS